MIYGDSFYMIEINILFIICFASIFFGIFGEQKFLILIKSDL